MLMTSNKFKTELSQRKQNIIKNNRIFKKIRRKAFPNIVAIFKIISIGSGRGVVFIYSGPLGFVVVAY